MAKKSITITRKLEFDTGHRLMEHEGKCRSLHGHRWICDITLTAPQLDSVGRILDFSFVKSLFGGWIDDNLDHNMVLCRLDEDLVKAIAPWCKEGKPYLMDSNPSSENLAQHLFEVFGELLMTQGPKDVSLVSISLHETPNCYATVV
jgi:6-pyruvoyltetrahydropterin/6-carboxytetrahydropterin synthase